MTATAVAVAQLEEVLVTDFEVVVTDDVAVIVPEMGVWDMGHDPVVAVEYVPVAEVEEHVAGTDDAFDDSPQE